MGAMAIAATILGMRADPNILSWASLPANLLLLHAWGLAPVAGWNHPSWSISAEWFAYLTFPVFAWAALKLRGRPILALALAASLVVSLSATFEAMSGFPLARATINWGALRIVPCFAFGCSLYLLWKSHAADRRKSLMGAVFFGTDSLLVLALGGLIFSLAQLAKSGSGWIGSAPLVYLGEISYSIYMICIPWQILFVNSAANILHIESNRIPLYAWIILVVGVIPLSAASYHLIEKPARAWMKLIADKRRTHDFATA